MITGTGRQKGTYRSVFENGFECDETVKGFDGGGFEAVWGLGEAEVLAEAIVFLMASRVAVPAAEAFVFRFFVFTPANRFEATGL